MAADFHTRKTNKTEHIRRYSEKEVEDLIYLDLCRRAGIANASTAKSKLYIDSKDGSTGPYREYVMTATIDHSGE